ncbi:hypothetical protein C8Q77DRAFT_919739 [Trametes polyzona]|nr:hypothetical protein C8Q77DRAFT_919739 [Trametes polyzona]
MPPFPPLSCRRCGHTIWEEKPRAVRRYMPSGLAIDDAAQPQAVAQLAGGQLALSRTDDELHARDFECSSTLIPHSITARVQWNARPRRGRNRQRTPTSTCLHRLVSSATRTSDASSTQDVVSFEAIRNGPSYLALSTGEPTRARSVRTRKAPHPHARPTVAANVSARASGQARLPEWRPHTHRPILARVPGGPGDEGQGGMPHDMPRRVRLQRTGTATSYCMRALINAPRPPACARRARGLPVATRPSLGPGLVDRRTITPRYRVRCGTVSATVGRRVRVCAPHAHVRSTRFCERATTSERLP